MPGIDLFANRKKPASSSSSLLSNGGGKNKDNNNNKDEGSGVGGDFGDVLDTTNDNNDAAFDCFDDVGGGGGGTEEQDDPNIDEMSWDPPSTFEEDSEFFTDDNFIEGRTEDDDVVAGERGGSSSSNAGDVGFGDSDVGGEKENSNPTTAKPPSSMSAGGGIAMFQNKYRPSSVSNTEGPERRKPTSNLKATTIPAQDQALQRRQSATSTLPPVTGSLQPLPSSLAAETQPRMGLRPASTPETISKKTLHRVSFHLPQDQRNVQNSIRRSPGGIGVSSSSSQENLYTRQVTPNAVNKQMAGGAAPAVTPSPAAPQGTHELRHKSHSPAHASSAEGTGALLRWHSAASLTSMARNVAGHGRTIRDNVSGHSLLPTRPEKNATATTTTIAKTCGPRKNISLQSKLGEPTTARSDHPGRGLLQPSGRPKLARNEENQRQQRHGIQDSRTSQHNNTDGAATNPPLLRLSNEDGIVQDMVMNESCNDQTKLPSRNAGSENSKAVHDKSNGSVTKSDGNNVPSSDTGTSFDELHLSCGKILLEATDETKTFDDNLLDVLETLHTATHIMLDSLEKGFKNSKSMSNEGFGIDRFIREHMDNSISNEGLV